MHGQGAIAQGHNVDLALCRHIDADAPPFCQQSVAQGKPDQGAAGDAPKMCSDRHATHAEQPSQGGFVEVDSGWRHIDDGVSPLAPTRLLS